MTCTRDRKSHETPGSPGMTTSPVLPSSGEPGIAMRMKLGDGPGVLPGVLCWLLVGPAWPLDCVREGGRGGRRSGAAFRGVSSVVNMAFAAGFVRWRCGEVLRGVGSVVNMAGWDGEGDRRC